MRSVWRRRDERGAQAVEFALLFSLVVAPLLYGIIAFGFVLNQQIAITQMAREAARTAATCLGTGSGGGVDSNGNNCNSKAVTGAKLVYPSFPSGGSITAGGSNNNCTSATAGPSTQVSYTVKVPPTLPIPGLSFITGRSTTPCGG